MNNNKKNVLLDLTIFIPPPPTMTSLDPRKLLNKVHNKLFPVHKSYFTLAVYNRVTQW